MTRLRGFVHVSTAYTNCDHPKRAVVHERVYPLLAASGKPLDIDAIAAELASLPPAAAEARVRAGPRAAGVSLHAVKRCGSQRAKRAFAVRVPHLLGLGLSARKAVLTATRRPAWLVR